MKPNPFLRRKDLFSTLAEVTSSNELHRTLTVTSLTSIGVGSVVGAGIFVVTGQAAAIAAGPALAISFLLSAASCFLCGICYAELSSAIPVSGSAYTFTYIAVGEFAAWTVAICLGVEYVISTAAVSVGWSSSVQALLAEFNIVLPVALSGAPLTVFENGSVGVAEGKIIDLPAVFINVVITVVLCIGIKESTTFNNIFVGIKLVVLAIFIGFGILFAIQNSVDFSNNLTPFIPPNTDGVFGHFGISGIFRGAGLVFFSYVGFDAVCAMAQETKNPPRDLPRGLINTIAICTFLYVSVTILLTGMVPYTELSVADPVPFALSQIHAPPIIRYLVDIGAVSGLTSVCLVAQMGMPRLLYSLSQDGLVSPMFGRVHATFKTPIMSTIVCGIVSGTLGGLLPLDVLGELVSFGTLIAFMMVCYSVICFRKIYPEFERPFTVPFVPLLPALGILSCGIQMFSLPPRTLFYYAVLELGTLGVYWFYGMKKSTLANIAPSQTSSTEFERNTCDFPVPLSESPRYQEDENLHFAALGGPRP